MSLAKDIIYGILILITAIVLIIFVEKVVNKPKQIAKKAIIVKDTVTKDSMLRRDFIAYVKHFEGNVSYDASDPNAWYLPYFLKGGHTAKGVSWWTYQREFKLKYRNHAEADSIRSRFHTMSDNDWYRVWYNGHWNNLQLDSISDKRLAYAISDFVWGSGTWGIIKLQESLYNFGFKLEVDGNLGEQTIKAVNSLDTCKKTELLQHYLNSRRSFYSNPLYRRGWHKRLDSLETLLLKK